MFGTKIFNKQRVKNQTAGVKGMIGTQLSFESNEQGAVKIYFPMNVTITKIRAIAIKAIANTDDATVQGANSTGNSTSGLLTFTASDAIATEKSATPTTNINVDAGSYYKLTPVKTTAGGKVQAYVEYVTR